MAQKGDAGRGGSDSAKSRGFEGHGVQSAGHADMGGGWNPTGTYIPSRIRLPANMYRQAPLPPQGLLAAAPTPPAAPIPGAQSLATQGLLSQQMPADNPFAGRFGPTHPLMQYLIGQIPQAGLPTAGNPLDILRKRMNPGDPRMA